VPIVIGATSADIGGKSGFMIAGAREASTVLADQQQPVWEYRFSYVAESIGQTGAQHASEIPYFFDNTAIKYGGATTAKDIALGKLVSRYLIRFVKTGNPNGAGLPKWPMFTRGGDEIMEFSQAATAVPQRDPWGAEIDRDKTRIEAARAAGHYNSLITPIGVMLDDPAAKEVLMRHLPDLVKQPQIDAARGMTLSAIKGYLPQLLTDAKLDALDTDLAKLPRVNR